MASIIARALHAHSVQLEQERTVREREKDAEAAALTALLEKVRPIYTERLVEVLDNEMPPMNWVPSGDEGITFVERMGTIEAWVPRLEVDLFGVVIVVTPAPGSAYNPCIFSVKPTSKADNGPLEFTNLAEFGAAVRAHYPLVAADHGNN